jgi:hypothetical protein
VDSAWFRIVSNPPLTPEARCALCRWKNQKGKFSLKLTYLYQKFDFIAISGWFHPHFRHRKKIIGR